MNTYDVGDQVVIIGRFVKRDGLPISPDTVSCKVKSPDGIVTTYLFNYPTSPFIEEIAEGYYELTLDITQYGKYYYYWYATGAGKSAGENCFEVRKSSVLEVV